MRACFLLPVLPGTGCEVKEMYLAVSLRNLCIWFIKYMIYHLMQDSGKFYNGRKEGVEVSIPSSLKLVLTIIGKQ